MGQDYRHEALADVQEHEEQEERHAGDDVRIEHRDVVEKLQPGFLPSVHIVDTDGGKGTEYCRDSRGHEGNDKRILKCFQQGSRR